MEILLVILRLHVIVRHPWKQLQGLQMCSLRDCDSDCLLQKVVNHQLWCSVVLHQLKQDFLTASNTPNVLKKMDDAIKDVDLEKRLLEGEEIIGDLKNIAKSVAIVLDGYVYSYPTVQAEIAGGRSSITGDFTLDEAKDLANILKSGKLPAPARIIEEAIVGPSLGEEAINAGVEIVKIVRMFS